MCKQNERLMGVMQKRIADLERLVQRQKDLLLQTLQLLRKQTESNFYDWKEADDWIFSELDFSKSELIELFKGIEPAPYIGSAKGDNTKESDDGHLFPEDVAQMAWKPIWIVPIGDADWEPQWRIGFDKEPYISVGSKSNRAKMYFLYSKHYGETWKAYLYPPLPVVKDEKLETEAVEWCPFCGTENSYPGWDTSKQGYVAVCKECGRQIMLCDECLHADDNLHGNCDWRSIEVDGKEYASCFRGSAVRNP